MGMIPQYLPGYTQVSDHDGRSRFEQHWNVKLPSKPGLNAASMFGVPSRLKAIWLDRHNPVASASYCDAGDLLEKTDFVILQNLFMTKTAEHADVVLPVAAYGEEDVTFTSTERRIQRAVKAIEPSLKLPSAWQHFEAVANRMGAKWSYQNSNDVLKEIADVIPFYSGVTPENLSRDYGRQWPCTHDNPLGTPILFTNKDHVKKFTFAVIAPAAPEDRAEKDFPYILSFGHSLYYWHQNTLVRHSETLKREYGILLLDYPEGFVEINTEDAKTLSIRDGQQIKLVSSRGDAVTFARVTSEVRHGTVIVPFFLQKVMQSLGSECSEKRGKSMHVRIEKAG